MCDGNLWTKWRNGDDAMTKKNHADRILVGGQPSLLAVV